jgi:serine protease Do
MNTSSKPRVALAAVALMAAAGFGAVAESNLDILKSTTILTSPAYAQGQNRTGPQQQTQSLPSPAMPVSIADVVERVGPAVVTVHVTQTASAGPERMPGFPRGTPFDEFFRRFFEGMPPGMEGPQQGPQRRAQPAPRERKVEGLGSGFIIDKSGLVVTNNHVVEDANEIEVELADGRKMKAKLIGRDEKTDLALIKVNAESDLPVVVFGDSDPVRVGEWVVAIGNPFGVGQTATAGIISAHHRQIGAGPFDDFLQIDAPINRGNSGGPTVNLKGEVIGVNTAIFSPSGGSVGIGFAIPSNLAKQIITDLADDGKVERGWLGVHIQEVTPEIAENLGLKSGTKGALVSKVEKGSPADKAGLTAGDVITAVDGKAIAGVRDLPRIIASVKEGDSARLTVWREGKERTMSAKVGKAPEAQQMAKADQQSGDVAGMKLAELDPQMRKQLSLPETGGVLVAGVRPGSNAAEAGLSAGDVIVAVGRTPVSKPEDVATQIASAEKAQARTVLLRVANEDGVQFVTLPVGKA